MEVIDEGERVRLVVAPQDLDDLDAAVARFAPRRVYLELTPGVVHHAAALEQVLRTHSHVAFGAHRLPSSGWLPPCTMPDAWRERPDAWRATLDPAAASRALPICTTCAIGDRCRFADGAALSVETLAAARPLPARVLPWERTRARPRVSPAPITPDVLCVTPWTTMEVVDLEGVVHQCCSAWTHGHRGALRDAPLSTIWNGPGYRAARRTMATGTLDSLCLPICPRLGDRAWSGARFSLQDGSPAFVANQQLIAQDIAERREEARGLPLHLAFAASTYCNYDCIMCVHGRTPRRDLPVSIWEELPRLLPTLRTLTLLGGEPFAEPRVLQFLQDFDRARWPDVAIDLTTNGSLLTEKVLARLGRCTFGDVTLSLNAGTPDVYQRVQRGIPLDAVLANLDALLAYRDAHPRPFGVSLSFVVQPANAHTLIPFAELARARDLRIRLLPLNPRGPDGLDYYGDPDAVAGVLEALEGLAAHVAGTRPAWADHARAIQAAITAEHTSRAGSRLVPLRTAGTGTIAR